MTDCKANQSAKKTAEAWKNVDSKKETIKKYSKLELNNLAKAHAKHMIKTIAAKKKKEESLDDKDLYNFDNHVKFYHEVMCLWIILAHSLTCHYSPQ